MNRHSESDAQSVALPWQEAQWREWLKMRRGANIPNALLLCGISGIGKASFARAVVEHLLCEHGVDQTRACGRCRACELNRLRTHPDALDIRPLQGSGAIGIDQIRDALEFLNSASHQSGWRCVIMAPAEAMNINAANALLKNLEEPGAKTLFALASDNPAWLPATIRSRCRRMNFPLPDADLSREWLRARDIDAAWLDVGGGRPLRIAHLAADGEVYRERLRRWADGWRRLLDNQHQSMEVVAQWKEDDAMEILDWLAEVLLDAMKWRVTPQLLADSREDLSRHTGERLSVEAMFDIWEELLKARRRLMAAGHPNLELLLADLLARAATAARRQRRRAVSE